MIMRKNYEDRVIALVTGEDVLIQDGDSAMELAMTVRYELGTKDIAISKGCIAEAFFRLSSGIAGEILQKFVNYSIRVAIIGDYSMYTSKSLRDFIYESNKGKQVFFVETEDEAMEKLAMQR